DGREVRLRAVVGLAARAQRPARDATAHRGVVAERVREEEVVARDAGHAFLPAGAEHRDAPLQAERRGEAPDDAGAEDDAAVAEVVGRALRRAGDLEVEVGMAEAADQLEAEVALAAPQKAVTVERLGVADAEVVAQLLRAVEGLAAEAHRQVAGVERLRVVAARAGEAELDGVAGVRLRARALVLAAE